MDREELEQIMRSAAQQIGLSAVISYLIDWAERAFYQNMSEGIQDEIATAAIHDARKGAIRS